MTSRNRLASWLVIALLTSALTALTTGESLRRYRELRSGWSWDLAYYNQWCWAITKGDGILSVRPISAYAEEGPSVWKMNYLAPSRFAILPFYALFPDPRTLLIFQNVVFWWVIPAAYTLVRSETRSEAAALSAAVLVPLTPLLWPLAWNDFRELQLSLPFVLWSVQGVRSRHIGLSVLSLLALLSCRQEFAVIVATLGFLPAREPENLTRTLNWRQGLLVLGLGWLLFAFFGYLKWMVGSRAPDNFVDQFLGPSASIADTLRTSSDFLIYGVGAWTLLACLEPRAAILALPWIWSLCNGRWAIRYVGTEEWHHVRYTIPPLAMTLAAGLLGYARLARWLAPRRGGLAAMGVVWILAALWFCVGMRDIGNRFARIPEPISRQEADAIWYWINQVGPDDSVLATYEVTAPLSSRKRLFSYIMDQNKPPGFPHLGPEFRWIFLRTNGLDPALFTQQGFEVMHRGPFLTILRRTP